MKSQGMDILYYHEKTQQLKKGIITKLKFDLDQENFERKRKVGKRLILLGTFNSAFFRPCKKIKTLVSIKRYTCSPCKQARDPKTFYHSSF